MQDEFHGQGQQDDVDAVAADPAMEGVENLHVHVRDGPDHLRTPSLLTLLRYGTGS